MSELQTELPTVKWPTDPHISHHHGAALTPTPTLPPKKLVDPTFVSRGAGVTILPGSALRLLGRSRIASVTLVAQGEIITSEGDHNDWSVTLPAAGVLSPNTASIPVPAGLLISASISSPNTVLITGDCWAGLSVVRDTSPDDPPTAQICGGWVTPTAPLGWPSQYWSQPGQIAEQINTSTLTNPAPGTSAVLQAPGQTVRAGWYLNCRLVTDLNVAARAVGIRVPNAASINYQRWSSIPQAALTTRDYCFAELPLDSVQVGTIIMVGARLPEFVGNLQALLDVQNIQVGDQLSNILFTFAATIR